MREKTLKIYDVSFLTLLEISLNNLRVEDNKYEWLGDPQGDLVVQPFVHKDLLFQL